MAETPSLESETAETTTETPNSESETAEIESETPNSESETVEIESETPNSESETVETTTETPKTPIIGGNYAYDDDEDEKTGTGFIWSPSTKTEETVANTSEENSDAADKGGIDTGDVLIGAGAAVVAGGAAVIGGGANVVTNAAGAAKDAIGNLIDFTPVTDRDKAKDKDKDAGAPVTAAPSTSPFRRWGIVIAACLLGVAVIAWLSTLLFGENQTKPDSTALMQEMNQKLYADVKTREDSLAIYNQYIQKAKAAGLDTAEFVSNRDALATTVSIPEPDPTGANGALAENNGKQAVTEANVQTNAKPQQIAQNATTTEGGDKPASDAAGIGAKPTTPKTEEVKVAGSVKPKVTRDSKAPAPGNVPAPVMQGRQARPTEYATPSNSKLPPAPKADIWKTYDKAWVASEGFRAVKKGDKWGWLHEDGKPFVGLNYEEVGSFKDGMAPLKKGGKWSFTTAAGKRISDYKFTTVTPFGATCPGLAKVSDGKKLYFIDKTGKEVAACK